MQNFRLTIAFSFSFCPLKIPLVWLAFILREVRWSSYCSPLMSSFSQDGLFFLSFFLEISSLSFIFHNLIMIRLGVNSYFSVLGFIEIQGSMFSFSFFFFVKSNFFLLPLFVLQILFLSNPLFLPFLDLKHKSMLDHLPTNPHCYLNLGWFLLISIFGGPILHLPIF